MENLQTDLSFTAEIKLYYDLLIPENNTEPAPLLIAVHGYGAHKRYMMREAKLIAPENFVIASIQAPHQHYREADGTFKVGFGWLSDYKPEESVSLHQNFISQLIQKLSGEKVIDRSRIFLYGFSQACALNFRCALANPNLFRGVLAVCGGIPGDLENRQDYSPIQSEVLFLYSDQDEFYPLEKYEGFCERLKPFAPNLTTKRFSAKHEITDEMRRDIRSFLAQK